MPRVRDRGAVEDKISFTPSILPRYLRRAKSVEELLPWLYLKVDILQCPELTIPE